MRGTPRSGEGASVRRLRRLVRLSELATVAWMGLILVGVVWEQIRLLPSRPPTPAQYAAAARRAEADWRIVYPKLLARLPEAKPELGAVWAVRSGRICGLIDNRQAGVHHMSRFYTSGLRAVLREDDERGYVHEWLECLDTRWVRLHAGTERPGYCGSALARISPLGRDLCRAPAP